MIETIEFQLRDGVDPDDFLAVDARFETGCVYQQAGLVRRTMTRTEGGGWCSFTIWSSQAHADAALAAVADSDAGRERDALIEPASVTRRCYAST